MSTGIHIETVKEITDSGDVGYRITAITALKRNQLPEMYLDTGPSVYFDDAPNRTPKKCLYLQNNGESVFINSWSYVSARFYSVNDMEKINAHIRAAGQHLTDVNAHLARERESWNGKVTFVDGVETTKPNNRPLLDESLLSKQPSDEPIKLAEKFAELWAKGRLLYRNNYDNHKFQPGQLAKLVDLTSVPQFNGEIVKISSIRENGQHGKAYYFQTDIKELADELNWVYEYRLEEI